MFDLSATAERLRVVKEAYREFLTRWALETAMDRPEMADRIFRDLDGTDPATAGLDTLGNDPFGRARFGLNPRRANADE